MRVHIFDLEHGECSAIETPSGELILIGVEHNSSTNDEDADIDAKTYTRYILQEGTNEEKRELLGCLKSQLKITEGIVTIE